MVDKLLAIWNIGGDKTYLLYEVMVIVCVEEW